MTNPFYSFSESFQRVGKPDLAHLSPDGVFDLVSTVSFSFHAFLHSGGQPRSPRLLAPNPCPQCGQILGIACPAPHSSRRPVFRLVYGSRAPGLVSLRQRSCSCPVSPPRVPTPRKVDLEGSTETPFILEHLSDALAPRQMPRPSQQQQF